MALAMRLATPTSLICTILQEPEMQQGPCRNTRQAHMQHSMGAPLSGAVRRDRHRGPTS